MPSEKWEQEEVTVTRRIMADITARKSYEIVKLAFESTRDENFANDIKELLLEFSTRVCCEMFEGVREEIEVSDDD